MKSKTKFTVDYFIKKFSAIPRSKWCTSTYDAGNGQYCALGHTGLRDSNDIFTNPEAVALIGFFNGANCSVVLVNDGHYVDCTQKTPKGRILAALRKIKKEASRGKKKAKR